MRKKTIVWAYLLLLSLGTMLSLSIPKNEVAAKDAIVIPGDAIRLRILANSDLESDQNLKRKVRDAVNARITVWVKDLTSIKKARTVIKSKLPEIQATAEKVVKDEGSKQKVNVKFGKVQFPTKLYGQFLYPAGDYEAILITLGAGEGANWWCVLFPPLCFLDFSNGLAVSNGFEGKNQPVQAAETNPDAKPVEESGSPKNKLSKPVTKASEPIEESDAEPVEKNSPELETKVSEQDEKNSPEPETKALEQDEKNSPEPETKASEQVEKRVPDAAKSFEKVDSEVKAVAIKATSEKAAAKTKKQKAPVYTAQDEEPVKVKFFVVELWNKIF